MLTEQLYTVYAINRGIVIAKSLVKATNRTKAKNKARKGKIIVSTYNWRRYMPGMQLTAKQC